MIYSVQNMKINFVPLSACIDSSNCKYCPESRSHIRLTIITLKDKNSYMIQFLYLTEVNDIRFDNEKSVTNRHRVGCPAERP